MYRGRALPLSMRGPAVLGERVYDKRHCRSIIFNCMLAMLGGMFILAVNMAFQSNFRGVAMLIGQYDYELERILQASSKIKKQFSNLLEREIKRMIERDDKTENYYTREHYQNYAAWLQRVKELVNQRPEND